MADMTVKKALAACVASEKDTEFNKEINSVAADGAGFLFSLIEERTRSGGELDVETLTDELVSFIQKKDPAIAEQQTPEVLSLIKQQIKCLAKTINDESYRSFLVFSTARLLDEIRENYKPSSSFPQQRNGMTTSSHDYSVENGSRLNSLSVDYWREFQRFRLDTGFFTAGSETAIGGFYGRGLKELVAKKWGPVGANVDGALAAFVILPQSDSPYSDFNDRLLLGGISSANFFAGTGHDFSSSFGLRGGAQFTPQLWGGMNLSPNTHDPIKAGSSLVFRPTQNIQTSLGAEAHFDLYPRNIQDPLSWQPNYAGVAPFLAVSSPAVDFESSLLMTGTGKEFRAEVGIPFEINRNHHFLVSMEGFITVDGTPVYPAGGFLNFSYMPDIGSRQGVVVSANIRTAGGSDYSSSRVYHDNARYEELVSNARFADMINRGPNRNIIYQCSQEEQRCVRVGNADRPGAIIGNCNSDDGITYECTDDSYSGTTIERTLKVSESEGTAMVVDQRAQLHELFVSSLWKAESLEEFANQTRFYSNILPAQQLEFLKYITSVLYKTYDDKGLVTLNGSGDVNDMGINDMYLAARNKIMNPYTDDKTTVCRGIARLATALAHRWGWEGYSAAVSAGDMLHVVSVVKPPKFDDYQVISWGDRSYAGANTIFQTLENFALAEGLPPQLQYQLYDHEGNYVRAVNTNLGNQLFSRTVAPDRLKAFLRGK